jgi:hypothetical protein
LIALKELLEVKEAIRKIRLKTRKEKLSHLADLSVESHSQTYKSSQKRKLMNTLRKRIVDPVGLASRSNKQSRPREKRRRRQRKPSVLKNINLNSVLPLLKF